MNPDHTGRFRPGYQQVSRRFQAENCQSTATLELSHVLVQLNSLPRALRSTEPSLSFLESAKEVLREYPTSLGTTLSEPTSSKPRGTVTGTGMRHHAAEAAMLAFLGLIRTEPRLQGNPGVRVLGVVYRAIWPSPVVSLCAQAQIGIQGRVCLVQRPGACADSQGPLTQVDFRDGEVEVGSTVQK